MDGEAIGASCPGATGVSDCRNYRLLGERVSGPVKGVKVYQAAFYLASGRVSDVANNRSELAIERTGGLEVSSEGFVPKGDGLVGRLSLVTAVKLPYEGEKLRDIKFVGAGFSLVDPGLFIAF